ncbi:hypothetical protein ACIP9G_02700 [Lysinibacillus sp. NPDC093197]|uniref:hypothetical protein n=1 Tax=Lysinibacillus sp. NPDC093197 TaxID=3364132 RepID=UPI0037F798E0
MNGTAIRDVTTISLQITPYPSSMNTLYYDLVKYELKVYLSSATPGQTFTLKDTITDQAGNKIIPTTAIFKEVTSGVWEWVKQ